MTSIQLVKAINVKKLYNKITDINYSYRYFKSSVGLIEWDFKVIEHEITNYPKHRFYVHNESIEVIINGLVELLKERSKKISTSPHYALANKANKYCGDIAGLLSELTGIASQELLTSDPTLLPPNIEATAHYFSDPEVIQIAQVMIPTMHPSNLVHLMMYYCAEQELILYRDLIRQQLNKHIIFTNKFYKYTARCLNNKEPKAGELFLVNLFEEMINNPQTVGENILAYYEHIYCKKPVEQIFDHSRLKNLCKHRDDLIVITNIPIFPWRIINDRKAKTTLFNAHKDFFIQYLDSAADIINYLRNAYSIYCNDLPDWFYEHVISKTDKLHELGETLDLLSSRLNNYSSHQGFNRILNNFSLEKLSIDGENSYDFGNVYGYLNEERQLKMLVHFADKITVFLKEQLFFPRLFAHSRPSVREYLINNYPQQIQEHYLNIHCYLCKKIYAKEWLDTACLLATKYINSKQKLISFLTIFSSQQTAFIKDPISLDTISNRLSQSKHVLYLIYTLNIEALKEFITYHRATIQSYDYKQADIDQFCQHKQLDEQTTNLVLNCFCRREQRAAPSNIGLFSNNKTTDLASVPTTDSIPSITKR